MHREILRGRISGEDGFHWRGREVTRLEGFSDAVFAFAVTLLVVSLEVPKTYAELIEAMSGLKVFGVCFALLAIVWYEHFRFFRRYGLESPWAVVLNCLLLFCVLFYVYPLKFLFNAAINRTPFTGHEVRTIFTVFNLGFITVFAVLSLLYAYAWRLRDRLALNPRERVRTLRSLYGHLFTVLMGLVATAWALLLPDRLVGFTGMLYSVFFALYYPLSSRIWRRREQAASLAVAPPAGS